MNKGTNTQLCTMNTSPFPRTTRLKSTHSSREAYNVSSKTHTKGHSENILPLLPSPGCNNFTRPFSQCIHYYLPPAPKPLALSFPLHQCPNVSRSTPSVSSGPPGNDSDSSVEAVQG